jgi:hypothetical protein
MLRGTQSDAGFDASAEHTFADQEAFECFVARVQSSEVAAEIKADEEGSLRLRWLVLLWLGRSVRQEDSFRLSVLWTGGLVEQLGEGGGLARTGNQREKHVITYLTPGLFPYARKMRQT